MLKSFTQKAYDLFSKPIILLRDITEPDFVHQWNYVKKNVDYIYPYNDESFIKIEKTLSILEIIPYEENMNG